MWHIKEQKQKEGDKRTSSVGTANHDSNLGHLRAGHSRHQLGTVTSDT